MKINWKNKSIGGRTPPKPKTMRQSRKIHPIAAIVLSFVGGTGSGAAVMAVMAMVLARSLVPLSLVEPMACAACGIGACVSGLILASFAGRQRLLCGLACGGFYSLCLAISTLLQGNNIRLDGSTASIAAVLLLGGMFGGTLTALRPQSSARVR